jgi:hypothetical protein
LTPNVLDEGADPEVDAEDEQPATASATAASVMSVVLVVKNVLKSVLKSMDASSSFVKEILFLNNLGTSQSPVKAQGGPVSAGA